MLTLRDFPPMLLQERPFDFAAPGWIYEIKYDGYRLTALVDHGQVELRTRGGADATNWFPETRTALATVQGGPHVFDGEICVLDSLGRSDFDSLHERARQRRWYEGAPTAAFIVFDLLVEGGHDITARPLEYRKDELFEVLSPAPPGVLALGHFSEGKQIFDEAVLPLQLEGLVAKHLDSVYQPGVRSPDWVKIKRKGAIPRERFRRSKQV